MAYNEKYCQLGDQIVQHIQELKGPIVVLGAGGFVGVNLLNSLLLHRDDVYGISQDHKNNWRFLATNLNKSKLISCDITDIPVLKDVLKEIQPKTIFNLAAYGAYSKQKEYQKIYNVNFNSTVNLIEVLKEVGFDCYVHAGSSSEYGDNSDAPIEQEELVPNSHYAVSKVASYYALKYYGKKENLPVTHLRLYSIYGPWEEPDRLIPVLISKASKQQYPPLVGASISRDFIYISDIVSAFIMAAVHIDDIKGEVFNIGTGAKTTIEELVNIVQQEFNISESPRFNSMGDRDWDLDDWYANSEKAKSVLGWKPEIGLTEGLGLVNEWQSEVDFNNAYWNWNKE